MMGLHDSTNRKTDADGSGTRDHCRRGFLADDDVEDWIYRKGQFAAPYGSTGRVSGGGPGCIRLLMCEREGWQPLGFPMSQASFVAVEKAFSLPRATLPLVFRNAGMEYYRVGFGRSEDGEVLQSICKFNLLAHDSQKRLTCCSGCDKTPSNVPGRQLWVRNDAFLQLGQHTGIPARLERLPRHYCDRRIDGNPRRQVVRSVAVIRLIVETSTPTAHHPSPGTPFPFRQVYLANAVSPGQAHRAGARCHEDGPSCPLATRCSGRDEETFEG